MRQKNNNLIYSPTDISNFEKCNFITVNEIKNLTTPLEVKETTETLKEFINQGIEIEQKYIQKLKDNGLNLFDGSKVKNPDRLQKTIEAMREGFDYIYHPLFEYENWIGEPDLLIRVDEQSALGDYSYIPADIKRAKEPKQENLTQVLSYCYLIEKVQERLPRRFLLINGIENKEHEFDLTNYYDAYTHLREIFENFVNTPNLETPEPCEACRFCRYLPTCNSIWSDTHIKNVTGITNRQIKKLKGKASTVEELAQLNLTSVEGIGDETLKKLKKQASLQLEKIQTGNPKYQFKSIPHGKGFYRIPQAHPQDIFFDLEGDPTTDGGHEYLFGYVLDGNFTAQWSTDLSEEKDRFQEIMEFFKDHLLANPQAHIYHYNHYETTALKRMTLKYDICADILDFLLRNEAFVDLYPVVRESIITSEKGLSIKDLEIFYMENRTALVSSGADSVDMFLKWRVKQDPQILQEIEDYNKEDCQSTQLLRDWLLEIQQEWQQQDNVEDFQYHEQPEQQPFHNEYDEEYVNTHRGVHDQQHTDDYTRNLIADTLEYHRREQKSEWWRYFSKEKFDFIELLDDMECIGGLQKIQVMSGEKGRQYFEYQYPYQEFKIKEGSDLTNIDGLKGIGTLESADFNNQRIIIEASRKITSLPDVMDITTGIPINPKNLRAALYRFARSFINQDGKFSCTLQLLTHQIPRFNNGYQLQEFQNEDTVENVKEAIANMHDSYLFIQGPPGTGKTYVTAHAIVHLLQNHKKIAITSNSHKAINNVLEWVDRIADQINFSYSGLKKYSSKSKDSKYESNNIESKSAIKLLPENLNLFAATKFEFSKDVYEEVFDYLFIDEAGQLAVPDVIASATCAKNLVLIGDPRQLGNPSDITHPGDSGLSVLDFILGEQNTVPPTLGIFLSTTRRMRSEITPFISESFYDSRLNSHPTTDQRSLKLEGNPLPHHSGIVLVEMEHQDNAQSSKEEIEVIAKLYSYFLTQKFIDEGVERDISADDILVVAPYNVQVNLIQKKLPEGNRTGTVDKFQGQEAPISILSMTSSDGDNAPRGINFLMDEARLNVAISRAQCLSIILINKELFNVHINSINQFKLKNNFLKLKQKSFLIDIDNLQL